MTRMKARPTFPDGVLQRTIAQVNRKQWWHVPPTDPLAYSKRGKFYASTYEEAEFYGRPNDNPEKVRVEHPLVGDEKAISKVLGIPPQHEGMSLEEIAKHDARWRNVAMAKGYDSIVLMAPKAFAKFKADSKLPRSLELNILNISANDDTQLKSLWLDAFEKWLAVLPDELVFALPDLFDPDAGNFYINPRYLRGSDFLMRWSQGRWSEEILIEAFGRNRHWKAIPFGPSSVAPEDPKKLELYFERLEASGVGKRPDLLIFAKDAYESVRAAVERLGIENIPFTPEEDLRFLIEKAVCAAEVENSLWVSKAMPHYGKGRPSNADPNLVVFLRSQKVPTVIIKDEDLKPLTVWQKKWNISIYVFHVFYDQGFFISFNRALELIKKNIVEVTEQIFFAPGGATTKKGIYKIWYSLASPLGEIVQRPDLSSKVVQDKNGHILPYVHFSGGRLELSPEIGRELQNLARRGAGGAARR